MHSKQLQGDPQLTWRIFMTMLMLGLVYLGFALVLGLLGVGLLPLLIVLATMLAAQYYYSDTLVLRAMRARMAASFEEPGLQRMLRDLAAAAGLPTPQLALVDSDSPNAFTTGRNTKNAVVALTTGLVDRLSTAEVRAVLAHEISHIKNKDMIVITMASFFAAVGTLVMRQSIFWGFPIAREGNHRGSLAVLVDFTAGLAGGLSYLLIRALSRYREMAADQGAIELTSEPSSLASALVRISAEPGELLLRENLRNSWTLSFFLIAPVTKGRFFTAAHPPLQSRLEHLEHLSRQLQGRMVGQTLVTEYD